MKRTKTKLVSSIVTLLVCFAMLIGSTFAWFTDSASTGVNKIQAGNLDVELYYSTDDNYDGANTTWKKVNENVKLFNPDGTALFEPGYTETVYLKVVNEGSLALDYKFSVDVINEVGSISTEGNQFKLSDYLKFGLKECGSTAPNKYSNREAVWASIGNTATKLGDMINAGSAVREGLAVSEEEYFTMSVYMPTDVGNAANYDKAYNAPEINFGLTLLASQASSESDSFDNQYDADDNATNKWDDPRYINTSAVFYPAIAEATATENNPSGGLSIVSENKVTVNGTPEPVLKMNVTSEDVRENDVFVASAVKTDQPEGIIVASEEQAVSYEVKLTKNGVAVTGDKATTNPVSVELFVGTKLSEVKLYHNGSPMDESAYNYDAITGFVRFSSKSFSPFTIVYKSGAVLVKDETGLRAAVAAGNDVCLANDIELGSELYLHNVPAMTLDGNGHKITAAKGFQIEQTENAGQYMLVKIETTNEVTLKDITLEHSSLDQDTASYHTLDIANSAKVILSNLTLIRNFDAPKGGAPLVVNNSNVTAKHSLNIAAGGNAWYGFNVDNNGSLIFDTNTKVNIDSENGVCGRVESGTFTDNTNTFVQTEEDLVVYPAAKIGDKKYATLDAAINAAGSGDTITLLKDSIGKGIGSLDASQTTTYRDSLTIDFNGHTYTMNDPAVGSTGTKSQAMHWGTSLGAVTLKNGTFKVAEGTTSVKMAMQNYINFTAENMTFDFSNIPVTKYGTTDKFDPNNGMYKEYSGLEVPMFNNNSTGKMILKNSTITMPESSVKGISNDGNEITIDSCTINGAVVIVSADKVVKVKDSVITKDVSPYFNSGYTVKTSEADDGYTVYTNQTVVNASNTEDLTNAIKQNSEVTVKLTEAGTYKLPEMSNKEVSIIGTKDTVIDMVNKTNNYAKSISFEGVTVNFGDKDYYGFQHTGKLTYKDCKITGKQFLYANEVEFNNCVFEQDIVDYNVWTYGAGNVLFKDCTFNCAGKSVLIYKEESKIGQTVEFKNCKFSATAPVDGKAAIEIDSSLLYDNGIYTVIIDQATANSVSGFGTGSVSHSSVWNNKKGDKATVIVAGNTVLSASSAS